MLRVMGLAALPLVSLSFIACASSDPIDELATESTDEDLLDGKADGAVDGTYTYYSIRPDLRKCAHPVCGGMYLERVNRSTTVCHNGQSQAACYTPELDWSESNLGPVSQAQLIAAANSSALSAGRYAIVRGRFAPTNNTPIPSLGRFIVTEAWVAEGDQPADGVFARVKDSGIVCISAPCGSLNEAGLNNSNKATISDLDFSVGQLTDTETQNLIEDLHEPSGIIVAGNRYTFSINGRTGKGRTVTNAYRRLANPLDEPCYIGGCSGEVCSEQEGVISTCEYREEYECYQTATCERQGDGTCGWTMTRSLEGCLAGY
ncbi:MAG: DUF6748 domain-containing protein [Kofleriaceae bacterium]